MYSPEKEPNEKNATPASLVGAEHYENVFQNHIVASLIDKRPSDGRSELIIDIDRGLIAEGIIKKYKHIDAVPEMAKVVAEIHGKSFEELMAEYGQAKEEPVLEIVHSQEQENTGETQIAA